MTKLSRAVEIQRRYYTRTAARYDTMHANETSTDTGITKFLYAFLPMLEVRSFLDVGTATGLGMRDLKRAFPGLFICGVEPVAAFLTQAILAGNTSSFNAVRATGEALPFPDASFDAACEFGILHHAANPNAVVKEMLRVAKKAVFLCDSNRFGQGSRFVRLIKLVLWKMKLWRVYTFLRTGGKGYMLTEGDGLAYSYSVFDSYHLVSEWADRIILIPTGTEQQSTSWFHPLLNSSSVLVCAFKERK
jgi:ubiquinone/menaquinone biosynthesis C-methylase UbiE